MRKCLITIFFVLFLTLPVFAGEGSFSVVYLPADDRPLNDQHMRLFADALGVELVMPERSLYARNGTDDRETLLSWLEGQQGDYFIISLDQLLSGGLLESREISGDTAKEEKMIDRLLEITDGKKVFFLDSLLRLACNVSCEKDLEAYHATLRYGRGEKGEALPETYLAVRQRKLRLNLYAAKTLPGYLLGVDDSWAGQTIQTGELETLRKNLPPEQIFSTFDALPRVALAKLYLEEMGCRPKVKVRYFGEETIIPAHNFQSAEEMMANALSFFGAESGDDLEILVKTEPGTAAIEAVQENQNNQVPTILINLCPREEAFERGFLSLAPGQLLAYAGYGSSVNAIHLGLSMGLARYCSLRAGVGEDQAQLLLMATLLADEFGYAAILQDVEGKAAELRLDRYDFRREFSQLEGYTLEQMKKQTAPVLFALKEGGMVSSLAPYTVKELEPVTLIGGYFPWHRCFEYHAVFSSP